MGEESRPNRKSIRWKSFDYSLNGVYFVTVCTHNRHRLFDEMIWCHKTEDYEERHVGATLCGRPPLTSIMIENWLLEIENKFDGVKLDSYAIMPDHIHVTFVVLRKSPVAGDHTGSPLPSLAKIDLGDIVGWFKTMTTNAYIQGVKQGIYQPFDSHLWQKNYYEHIIRDEDELYEIRRYISENPARFAVDGKEPF